HLAQPAPPVVGELLVAGGTSRCHGGQDPAAGPKDLEVIRAALPEDELALAGAAEEEVGVGVDQARCDRAATGIETGEPGEGVPAALERLEQVAARSDGEDVALPAGDR